MIARVPSSVTQETLFYENSVRENKLIKYAVVSGISHEKKGSQVKQVQVPYKLIQYAHEGSPTTMRDHNNANSTIEGAATTNGHGPFVWLTSNHVTGYVLACLDP